MWGAGLKVLMIANMYPSKKDCSGNFIRDQVKSLESLGIYVDKVVKKSRNPLYYIPFLLQSVFKLIFSDYDVVHAHFVPHSALIPAIFKRRSFVIQFHGSDARLIPWRNRFNYYLTAYVISKADMIIAVSEEIKTILTSKFYVPRSKVAVISVGVDTELFSPMNKNEVRNDLGLNIDKKIVLFVGRITEMKGVDLLYQCAEHTLDIEYIFIGRKNDEKGKELNNCKFVGEVSHLEIPMWMNAADVLVLPSYSEGLPTVVAEALSCGIPAIVTDVGGCSEIVKDGVTGYVIKAGDVKQLQKYIICLISDDALRYNMGIEGRKDVTKKYDHVKLIHNIVGIYELLIESTY
jgi:glycosyltransferase involved in cell wall biosynthesis